MRRLIICPWFGPFPPWMNEFMANVELLRDQGYDFLFTSNLELFNQRVEAVLGFRTPIERGSGKLHDYRPAFGELFADELRGYEFWGHTDFDCVFGRVDKFMTPELLDGVDIYADESYICGPWTLYRNIPQVNSIFREVEDWRGYLQEERTSGWGEKAFSRTVAGHRRHEQGHFHRFSESDFEQLRFENGSLYVDQAEIMMFHFRRTKQYPAGITF